MKKKTTKVIKEWMPIAEFPVPTVMELAFRWKDKPVEQPPYITGVFTSRGDNGNGQVTVKESNKWFDLSYFDAWSFWQVKG